MAGVVSTLSVTVPDSTHSDLRSHLFGPGAVCPRSTRDGSLRRTSALGLAARATGAHARPIISGRRTRIEQQGLRPRSCHFLPSGRSRLLLGGPTTLRPLRPAGPGKLTPRVIDSSNGRASCALFGAPITLVFHTAPFGICVSRRSRYFLCLLHPADLYSQIPALLSQQGSLSLVHLLN